jgi:transmembrane sensor
MRALPRIGLMFKMMGEQNDMDRCRDEAFAWVVRLIPGNATKADVEAFAQWSAQNSAHARAFAEAQSLWEASADAGRNVFERSRLPVQTSASARAGRWHIGRRGFLAGSVAASAAAASYVLIRPPFDLWPPILDVLEADYRTGKGEQRHLKLADASIDMNTETSMALRPGRGGAKRIELLMGEGAFSAGARPFEVVAGKGYARASNSDFNMRREGDQVLVTCSSGEVEIRCGTETASLLARQQISYSDRGMGPMTGVDPAVVTAWQRGFLVFHDTPLSTVIGEVNRYRHGRIILVNSELGRRLVNARFRLDRIDDVVTKMTNAFGATATWLVGGLVVLS